MLHIIMPFSRVYNKQFYIDNLRQKGIIWHPVTTDSELFKEDVVHDGDWIVPCIFENLKLNLYNPSVIKLNKFIKTANIIDDDMYCFINDDDWMEEDLVEKVSRYDTDVVFIAMKRGYVVPEESKYKHGTSTLIPYKGVKRGFIGFEQIFVKGHVLKQIEFVEDINDSRSTMPDGVLAEWLQENFEVTYVNDIFAYFNYLELGRWVKNEKVNMETIRQRFERVKRERRDISEHLDTLYNYAKECDVIVELGINEGISTTAFCLAVQENPEKKFYNYDYIEPTFQKLLDMCKEEGVEFDFTLADVLTIEIPECDLLFTDTLHTYGQLRQELALHAGKVSKYIIIHDTETFGKVGVVPGTCGLQPAIDEFLQDNSEWSIKVHFRNNNGLTILGRER